MNCPQQKNSTMENIKSKENIKFCSICDTQLSKFQLNNPSTLYSEILDEFNLINFQHDEKHPKLFCPSCEESLEKLTILKQEMDKMTQNIDEIVSLLKSKGEHGKEIKNGKIYLLKF